MKRKKDKIINMNNDINKDKKKPKHELSKPISIKIVKIRIFPIKSCRSILLHQSQVINGRLKNDRKWSILDTKTNNCLAMKNEPMLSQIQPFIEKSGEKVKLEKIQIFPSGKFFHFEKNNLKEEEELKKREVIFRGEKIECFDMGEKVGKFLSEFLKKDVRLIEQIEKTRNVEKSINSDLNDCSIDFSFCKDEKLVLNSKLVSDLNFGNRTPICILSEETVDYINDNDEKIFVKEENYRANIIVKGCSEPFEEDTWKTFHMGDLKLNFIRGAPRRCPMTGMDQQTGILNQKILKILRDKRGSTEKYPNVGALVCCLNECSNGKISVGQEIGFGGKQE